MNFQHRRRENGSIYPANPFGKPVQLHV